ncbi:ABC transporter ATP-binding protein [Arenicellales bacterium IMCC58067]
MRNILKYFADILFLLDTGKRRIPWLIVIFIGVSVLDILGISLVGAYVSLATSSDPQQNGYLQFMTSWGKLIFPDLPLLVSLGIILVALFFFKAVAGISIQWSILNFSNSQMVRLRSWSMQAFQSLDYQEYLQRNSAEYIQSVQRYVNQTVNSFTNILRLLSDGIVSLIILIFLASINGAALLVLLLFGAILFLGYDQVFRRKVGRVGREANLQSEAVTQAVQEGIKGLKEVRILGRERFFFEHVVKGSKLIAKAETYAAVVSAAPRYLVEVTIVLFVVSLVGIVFIQTGDLQSSYPVIGMFAISILRLGPTITTAISSTTSLRTQRHGVSVLSNDLRNYSAKDLGFDLNEHATKEFRSFSLQSVSFKYSESKQEVIKNFSLDIPRGAAIGIIGASGSGKTTLVDLILGLLKPDSGDIFYNGVDLQSNLSAWWSNVAYLPQEIFLIDDTIKRNISLLEDDEVDKCLMEEVVRVARLEALLKEMPDGIDSILGEHGMRLSGGQRQRVALARAFYHNRSVLILDEATSALDNETEKEIVSEISRLKGSKTIIVIAHRLSTLRDCDVIIRLENGQLVQKGSYSEVIG